jgi:hypothetical protein
MKIIYIHDGGTLTHLFAIRYSFFVAMRVTGSQKRRVSLLSEILLNIFTFF